MRLGMYAGDHLIKQFETIEQFDRVETLDFNAVDEDQLKELDVIICQESDINDVIRLEDCIHHESTMIYYITDTFTAPKQILKGRRIKLLSDRMSDKQLIETICLEVFEYISEDKKVCCFFGVDDKVGTTQVAGSLAQAMSLMTDKRILLLHLNEKPSDDYVKTQMASSIDDIKIALKHRMITADQLEKDCYPNGKVLEYFGFREVEAADMDMDIEDMEYLIDLGKEFADIILIDAGNRMNFMALGVLFASTYKVMVTTPFNSARRAYERQKNQIYDKIPLENYFVVTNRAMQDYSDPYSVAKAHGGLNLGKVDETSKGVEAEEKERYLYSFEESQPDFEELASGLLKNMGILAEEVKKPSLWSRIGQRFKSA